MYGRPGMPAAAESRWERELRRLGVAERDALTEMVRGTRVGLELRAFAVRNAAVRFVPEAVLECLGVRVEIELAQSRIRGYRPGRKGTRMGALQREIQSAGVGT